jgi:RHS repeat-associated protein
MIETTNDPVNGISTMTRYQHTNHQGSTTLETDEYHNIITYEEYHPFGTTSYQATNGAVTAAAKRYRYTGMERDDETGLEYHNARYYISWLGRWMNCDPIGIGDGVNVYAYCRNNPVGNVDSSGTQVKPKEDTNWVQPVGKLPYNKGIFANTTNFLANNTVGADVTNAVPNTYKYVKGNGGLSGVVANIVSEGERISNKVENAISNAAKDTKNYLNNTSGKQANVDAVLFDQKLGGGIINFVKESAQAFTKLENYDLAFQLLVFHKLSNTKLPANPNTIESTLLKKSDGKKVDNLIKVENEKPFKIIETLEGKNKSIEGARILKGTIASSGSTLEVNISMIYKSKDYTGKVFANLIKK